MEGPRDFAMLYNTFNMTRYGIEIDLLALGDTLVIVSGGGSIYPLGRCSA